MGVTLERVQFKFASIIGELCSEPLVLSQFAVWLDLRLAEYKLKGHISLDCSGDVPPPCWLRGMERAMMANRTSQGIQHGTGNTHSSRDTITASEIQTLSQTALIPGSDNSITCDDPQSSDNATVCSRKLDNEDSQYIVTLVQPDIIIKDEQSCDSREIYPATSQTYDNKINSRKRTATDMYVQPDIDSTDPHISKHGRMMETDSLTNQSLISIIGNMSGMSSIVSATADNNDTITGELLGKGENYSVGFPADIEIVEETHLHGDRPTFSHTSGYNYSSNRGKLDLKKYKDVVDWIRSHYRFAQGQRTKTKDIYESCCGRFNVSRTVIGQLVNTTFPGIKTQPSNGKYFYYNLGSVPVSTMPTFQAEGNS